MILETVKRSTAVLTREELIALVNELTNRVRELEENLRLKKTPTTSKNSSQLPSQDFKGEKKKRKRSKPKGAKNEYKKQDRALVDNPDKVFYALVDNC